MKVCINHHNLLGRHEQDEMHVEEDIPVDELWRVIPVNDNLDKTGITRVIFTKKSEYKAQMAFPRNHQGYVE